MTRLPHAAATRLLVIISVLPSSSEQAQASRIGLARPPATAMAIRVPSCGGSDRAAREPKRPHSRIVHTTRSFGSLAKQSSFRRRRSVAGDAAAGQAACVRRLDRRHRLAPFEDDRGMARPWRDRQSQRSLADDARGRRPGRGCTVDPAARMTRRRGRAAGAEQAVHADQHAIRRLAASRAGAASAGERIQPAFSSQAMSIRSTTQPAAASPSDPDATVGREPMRRAYTAVPARP